MLEPRPYQNRSKSLLDLIVCLQCEERQLDCFSRSDEVSCPWAFSCWSCASYLTYGFTFFSFTMQIQIKKRYNKQFKTKRNKKYFNHLLFRMLRFRCSPLPGSLYCGSASVLSPLHLSAFSIIMQYHAVHPSYFLFQYPFDRVRPLHLH